MTFLPSDSLGSYLPESIVLPKDNEKLIGKLKTILEDQAKITNRKETGSYEEVEQLTSQQYFGATPQTKRYVYRKVFNIGAVAAGATLNTAHGITGIVDVTRFYGTVYTAIPDYRPVPYSSVAALNQQIELNLAGANIVLINGAASPNIVRGIIVIEYVKN